VLKISIPTPENSPWQKLFRDGDDSSFLNLTGFTRESFLELCQLIFSEEELNDETKRGRKHTLNCFARLGLLLFFVGSRVQIKYLCMIFGAVPSIIDRDIKEMISRVIETLRAHPAAMIKFPNFEEMTRYAELVRRREPSVRGVIGFLDGLSLPTQCSSEEDEQNAFYNGYYHDTAVNNIFLFSPLGKILFACINCPGSWHDSIVAAPLIALCITKLLDDFKICVDQGFPRSGDLRDKFVGPISRKRREKLHPLVRDLYLEESNYYVSLRQAAEWGMRALQGSFPRLKARLPADADYRRDLISCIILLHNFRTDRVGLNQIATVFDLEYQKIINIEGYDRIHRYYANI
jgi:hypothetical protein